jgi:hypothetical protein
MIVEARDQPLRRFAETTGGAADRDATGVDELRVGEQGAGVYLGR